MMLLMLAVLPGLFWEEPPDSAAALREAGIVSARVPPAQLEAWKQAGQLSVEAADVRNAVKVPPPGVQYRPNEASATHSPWLIASGWRFLRNPRGSFLYDARGAQVALAAAEAFCFGANALVRADRAGLKPFAEMLDFLRGLGENTGPPVADIGFIDDGSGAAGEVMNLMVRNNLLFQVFARPPRPADARLKLMVQLGSREFPLEDAKNPGMTAHEVRAKLTDEKRSIRIYGSAVVVARLTVLPDGIRVHLLNYAGGERKVDGLRVRVLGQYAKHRLAAAGSPQEELLDYTAEADATEFTLPELKTYAVVDLSR
ncbi:MAG: hypothetical protein ABSH49_28660 [Bryobacteraceae bacterium]